MIKAKVLEDSISIEGKRLTTLQVTFHRFILPEFNTHRAFSRNFSSSRAIPTAKLIEQVRTNPALPVHWGQNQAGMQAEQELDVNEKAHALREWRLAAYMAADSAEMLSKLGCHKQIVNRVLEPYIYSTGIISSTEWENFFELRAHPDAQPEIQELAYKMQEVISNSEPKLLNFGEWHLPFIYEHERVDQFFKIPANRLMLPKISAARCCRVSYLKQDGTLPNIDDDLALFQRLAGAIPIHASPLEHQATPDMEVNYAWCNPKLHGNFSGWRQYRKLWEESKI